MAMIATFNPCGSANSHFKITDVTDEYENNQSNCEDQEGSLVEYNRLNEKENQRNQPNICAPSVLITQRNHVDPIFEKSSSEKIPLPPRTMHKIDDVRFGCSCKKESCYCPGYEAHRWRKVCVHCKCDRSDHDTGPSQVLSVYERLGIDTSAKLSMQSKATRGADAPGSVGHGYAWVPPGLLRSKIEEYMAQLPNHVVPRISSRGEKYREKQLMIQLPRQDLSAAYCKHLLSNVENKVFEEFVNARNEIALDIGFVCPCIPMQMECKKCTGILERSDMAVMAPKLGDRCGWHPACFTCGTCEQLLVDLTYCVKDGRLYCERHYAELHKPRCCACDEDVFYTTCTKYSSKKYNQLQCIS